tara:strand:- start:4417 stop:4998 length:582 start_codon:yes stop_codon:yes gene_type:complete
MTARFAQGKYALSISDRSGLAFPYLEMVREWTGSWVHISEYESKSPQLQIKVTGGDPQALMHARPARTEFATTSLLQFNPFFTTTAGTSVIRVYQPGHARTLGNTYRFYGPPTVPSGTGTTSNPVATYADVPNFDGIQGAQISKAAGHIISQWGTTYVQTYNNYQFTVSGSNATNGNVQGGGSVSIGPVTIEA